ncbi:uncharacterized protein LOC133528684 isoform X2 [Cydia pomonella]|uniref:uncharacterized protein LOC133528684 isoform X2 n=1 Tax=Cydia pomonella TaxID=82600 RepID=UPI002ADE6C9C|nr:uncharacterized protein LOC133528684 isoform X2 [Cydia pomonella]
MDFNFEDVESEDRREVTELSLLTPASSRAASPIDQELINQVHHQIDKQLHALKCIKLTTEDKEKRIKIMREAKTLAELKHENLLRYGGSWINIYYPLEDISCDDNDNTSSRTLLCILTELCDTNLTQLIEADLHRQPSRARNIFWKIAEGLAYLHARGFIHGDLRSDNILIKKKDLNKKGDCGVCFQGCYSSFQLPCRHICCSLCVKVIAFESKDCAICQFKIPFGYFDNPVDNIDKENQVYQWKYAGKKGWYPYDNQHNVALENAFNDGCLECSVRIQHTMYRINFQDMVQMQETDRTKTRKIRREPPSLMAKDDDTDDVKIGDFGLTQLTSDMFTGFTQKDDMYRLGVILLDMFMYSIIDKNVCSGWNVRLKKDTVLRNKDPENIGLIYLLGLLLKDDPNERPTCAELLGPVKRGFEQKLRWRKRQAEQLQDDNMKRMRETQLR